MLLLRGRLPLEGFLVLLGKEALQRGGIVPRPPDVKISYILPITQVQFYEMLNRFQRQSNMVVKNDPTKWTVQKFADEGAQSPFMARLLIGITRLRDVVFPDQAGRDKFDKPYEFVTTSLMNARSTAKEVTELWEGHARRVTSGEVARLEGQTIHIDESIDKELRKQVESFLNAAVRALKQGMQNLATEMQVNIGFLFKQQGAFDTGIAALEATDPILAEYVQQSRIWSGRLIESRNAVEHNGWTLPRVHYVQAGAGIRAEEPLISGQPVTEYIKFALDRLICFVEEFTAHCLQEQMPAGITITELPFPERLPDLPERFRVTLATGGLPVWRLIYHASSFETT